MATFYYVKGDPVPNAQSYELWKGTTKKENNVDVFVPGTKVETQEILQQLSIPGTIAASGKPAETSTIVNQSTTSNKLPATLAPVTELTENGYVHYIRLEGTMSVDSYEAGIVRGVPFSGKLYLTSAKEIELEVYGLIQGYIDTSNILLQCQWKEKGSANTIDGMMDVEVFKGLTGTIISVGVDDGIVTAYSAHTAYRRTDFIPISELTDHLRASGANSEYAFSCVGAFSNGTGEMPGYKIAFYGGMSYSTFKGGLKYSDFDSPYLDAQQVRDFAEDFPGAQYVIFSSAISSTAYQKDADFVSVGGINMMLTGDDEVSAGDILAVKAIGDGVFYADSEYSRPVTYTPKS